MLFQHQVGALVVNHNTDSQLNVMLYGCERGCLITKFVDI